MKIFTQEEFDALPVVNGWRECPSGDYSLIKSFPHRCKFWSSCEFGNGCEFGEVCYFGKLCHFGNWCNFGKLCHFGNWCNFGEMCGFGELCYFGNGCDLGRMCGFRKWCYFGECNSFGEDCSFAKGCEFEGGRVVPLDPERPFVAVDRIGSVSSKVYFFMTADGLRIRAGCFFGTEDDLEASLAADGDAHKTSVYRAAVALAKLQLGEKV